MKVFILATLVAVVASQSYPAPFYPASRSAYPSPASPSPDYPSSVYLTNEYNPMPYSFEWAVKDDYYYNDYTHQETSDGKGYLTGSYRVLLADGRIQTVTYKADDYTGYIADVKYEGEAKYNEYKPAYTANYKPTYTANYKPTYPAPAYKPNYPSYQPDYPTPYYPARY